jgi:hypothetical protein
MVKLVLNRRTDSCLEEPKTKSLKIQDSKSISSPNRPSPKKVLELLIHIAMDVLTAQQIVTPVRPLEDLRIQLNAPCRAHKNKSQAFKTLL